MLDAFIPRIRAFECTLTKEAARVLWWVAQPAVAASLVLGEIALCDGMLFGRVRGLVLGGGVHAAKVLSEEVLAVEVVVIESVVVVWVYGRRTQVTAPVAKLDVLCADMPLPLVLGTEVRLAPIWSERAGERAALVCPGVCFNRALRGFRAPAVFLIRLSRCCRACSV